MPRRLDEAVLVFTPGSPIRAKDYFRGRVDQLNRVIAAIPAPGIHPVIFGQRGVGKTSLANILQDALPDSLAVRVACHGGDDFAAIWGRVLSQAMVRFKVQAFGFSPLPEEADLTLASMLEESDDIGPSEIASVLAKLNQMAIFIIDEFDRVADQSAIRSMADLIKTVSDDVPLATIVLVGVGETITDLIHEHGSVVRNLRQIKLPKMDSSEIRAIFTAGFSELSIECDAVLINEAVVMCDGFPHYAHLIGQSIASVLLSENVLTVTPEIFERSCGVAVDDAAESLNAAYAKAVATAKKSKYPIILQACGLAKHDDRGVFRASEVAEAASELSGDSVTIPAVTPALGAFTSDERGNILETVVVSGRNQYRFRDPMMRPYLRLKARGSK